MSDPTAGPFREDYEALTAPEALAQVQRLEAALRAAPGSLATGRWQSLERSYAIWGNNIRELLDLLAASETDDQLKIELIRNMGPGEIKKAFFTLLDQRLFNMLSAVFSLVEHTFGLRSDYPGSAFLAEFQTRNDLIAKNPRTFFLRKFRNYLLHAGHAPFRTTMKSGDGASMDLKVLINSEVLLESPAEWNVESRAFIESHPDGIHLRKEVEEYRVEMVDLYQWTFAQFEILHKADIDEANDLVRRLNLTQTRGASDGKDWQQRVEHMAANLSAVREGRPQTDFRTGEPIPEDG